MTYYKKHKEKVLQKHKCECGGVYNLSNKFNHERTLRHATYEKYGEIYTPRTNEYYFKVQDCECGGKFSLSNMSRHLKTKRHLFHESWKTAVSEYKQELRNSLADVYSSI